MRTRWLLGLALWLFAGCGTTEPLAESPGDAGATASGTGGAPVPGAGGGVGSGGGGGSGGSSPTYTTAGDGGPAPTWTTIYSTLLANPAYASSCVGAPCHDPGKQKGIDLSTRDAGYRSLASQIVPGAPQSSKLVTVLQSGAMPETRPHMPAADLDLIRAWIASGAQND